MDSLIQTLSIWSYLLVFAIIFAESAGLPLPGFSVAMMAAALAGQGQLSFWLIYPLTVIASTLGGMSGYWIGVRGGRNLITRYGRYVLITPQRFNSAEKLFHKHGDKAVLFGRYLPILCFMAGILSGIAHLPYRRFFIYNLAGALLWSTSHLTLGFVFGRSLDVLHRVFNNFFLAVIVIGLIVGLVVVVRRKLQNRRTLVAPALKMTIEEPGER